MKDKGLTNEKEVSQYNKNIEALLKTADQLSSKFSSIKLTGLADNIREAKKEVARLEGQLKSTIETTKTLVKAQVASTGKGYKTNLIAAIGEGDDAKRLEYEQKITQELQKQTDEAKKRMDLAQQDLNQAKDKLQNLKNQKQLEESTNYGRKNTSLSNFGLDRMSFRKPKSSGKGSSFSSDADFDIINEKFIQIVGSAKNASSAIKDFNKYLEESKYSKTAATNIEDIINNVFTNATQKMEALKAEIASAEKSVKSADTALNGAKGAKNAYNVASNAQKNTAEFLQGQEYASSIRNTANAQYDLARAASSASQTEGELNSTVNQLVAGTNSLTDATAKSREEQSKNAEEINRAAAAQRNYDNEFERIKYHVKYLLSITNAWRQVRSIVTKTFNDVSKLDKAFAEIAMVTNYSVSDMWSQYSQYAEMANKLGQSTESVIQASGLYYQQGLDTAEALKLTEDTMKLATLAGLDFKDATSQMTAALRAFHMEMDEGSHVTDVYAEVAANAAVDVQGLSDAMSATAAIANSSGMAFETTTAMLATMVEATQEAPKNLGTAMKAVLARFSELKENVDSSESEFEDLDYNKVDKALKSVGISIKDANGQFRDMDDVLLELGAKWDSLSRNAQRYIATIAAGSRQQSRFIALMENHKRTMELIEVATDSTGRANEQFAKYADTIEYKVNKIKNSWEELRVSLMNKDTYNGFLDIIDNALQRMKGMDIKDFGIIAAWAVTIGKTLLTGLLSGISDGGNKIRSAIAKAINKQKYTVDLQANIDASSWKNVKQLRQGVWDQEARLRGIQNTNPGTALQVGQYSSDELKNQVAQLNILYERRKNIIQQIEQEMKKETSDEAQIAVLNEQLKENDQQRLSIQEQISQKRGVERTTIVALNNQRNEGLQTELRTAEVVRDQTREYNKQRALLRTKWTQSFATALGQATTTALSMALTGSFSASEIAKTTKITSAVSAASGFLNGLSTGNYTLGIVSAGVAAAAFAAEKLAKHIEKTKENERLANDEVYKHKKQLEELEKVQEEYNKKLDIENSKYNDIKEQWDGIKEASETYKELSDKSLLDEEETTQLVEATQSLAELIPELVVGYDDQANAIIDTSKNYDELINKYQKAEQNAKSLQKQAEATAEALGLVQQYIELEQSQAMTEERRKIAEEANTKTWETNFIGKIRHWAGSPKEEGYLNLYDILSQESFENFNDLGDPQTWIKEVWADTSENASAWQQLVIDTLKETTGAKNVSSLTLNSKADEIIDSFDDNDKVWQEFAKKFKESLDNSEAKIEELNREAEAKKSELLANIPALRQSIIEGIIADLSTQGWDEVNLAQYKDFLNNQLSNDKFEDFISKAIDEGADTNGEVIEEGIKDYLSTFSISKEDLDRFKTLNEEQLEILSNFAEDINNLPFEEVQKKYSEAISKLIPDGEGSGIRQLLSEKVNKTKESIVDAAKETAGLVESTDFSYSRFYEAYSKVGAGMTSALTDAITDSTKDEDSRAAIAKSMVTLLEQGLDPQAISTAINSVDWSNMTIFDEDDFFTILKGALGRFNFSDAQIQEIFKVLSEPFLNRDMSSIDTSAMVDKAIEKYDKFAKKGTELTQYFEEGRKSIALEGKELKQVQKALEDTGASAEAFIETTENGTTIFNVEAAKEWYNAQTNNSKKIEEQIRLGKEQGTLDKEQIKNLEEELSKLRQEEGVIRSILSLEQSIDTILTKRAGKISASISAYKTMMTNFYSKGAIDSSSFSSWAESMLAIDPTVKLGEFFNEDSSFKQDYYQTFLDSQIAELENLKDLDKAQKESLLQLKLLRWSLSEANAEIEKQALEDNEIVKAQKDVEEAHKKVADALKEIAKAQQNVIDKQNELNETMYGSDNFKNQLDPMYNYSTLNQRYADAAARAKDILDNPNIGEDTKSALQSYLENSRNQLLNYLAQNEVYGAAAQSDLSALYEGLPQKLKDLNSKFGANYDTNVRQYFKIIDGVLTADIEALNRAALPDEIKNEIATLTESYNNNTDNISKNNDAIRKLLKERQEIHKANLQAEVSIQEKIAEVLKEKYEEQVEDLKDKYDAMKDADDDYLKALQASIDKQRKLREQENKWEDLAQKRKKLSLQQRDTSGANAVSNQKLEKEIQKDEQSLLDESIDNIINNLKELYELQDETRQDEIEYQEALKDNTNWIAEANKIVLGLGSAEDFINWMKQNSDDWKDKTAQQIELEEMELTEMFQKHQEYMEEQEQQITDSLAITEAEVQRVISDTSEALVSESQRSLDEISAKVDDAITKAKDALVDAMDALAEKQRAYNDAVEEEGKKVSALASAYAELAAQINAKKAAEDIDDDGDNDGGNNDSHFSWPGLTDGYWKSRNTDDDTKIRDIASYEEEKGKSNLEKTIEKKLEEWFKIHPNPGGTGVSTAVPSEIYDIDHKEVVKKLKEYGYHGYYNDDVLWLNNNRNIIDQTVDHTGGIFKKFATGGLVNYTGPAWVDGSPTRPEAFLSANDTENIAAMTDVLASLRDLLDFTTYSQSPTINNTNRNDTTINVTVNVENIADDYDVDSAIERIKQDIVDAASYAGSNVILNT